MTMTVQTRDHKSYPLTYSPAEELNISNEACNSVYRNVFVYSDRYGHSDLKSD